MNTHDDRLAATIAPHARGPGGSILRTPDGDMDVLHHWDGARLLILSPPGTSLPSGDVAALLMDVDDGANTVLEVRGSLRPQESKRWRLAWLLAQIRRHGMGAAIELTGGRSGPCGDIAHLDVHHAAVTVVDRN